jgi:hypothetical protein
MSIAARAPSRSCAAIRGLVVAGLDRQPGFDSCSPRTHSRRSGADHRRARGGGRCCPTANELAHRSSMLPARSATAINGGSLGVGDDIDRVTGSR